MLEWVIQQRIAWALRLLEETEATVPQVATRAGFGTATCMRQHFAHHLNISPTAYRASTTLGLPLARLSEMFCGRPVQGSGGDL